jgi:hypothetical protein
MFDVENLWDCCNLIVMGTRDELLGPSTDNSC